jgi:hydroxyethylthiazole kinase
MKKAMLRAREKNIPIVFDPVGVGATAYRTQTANALLRACAPALIRGNASEISCLVSPEAKTRGVDSTLSSDSAVEPAKTLSGMYGCVVSVSGVNDYIIAGDRLECVRNGHPLMRRVTGMGCSATALSAAFAAVNPDFFAAAAHAMAVMGIAGEIAAASARGPGTFQAHFFDALYNLSLEDITGLLKTGG